MLAVTCLAGCRGEATTPDVPSPNISESDYEGYGMLEIGGVLVAPVEQTAGDRTYEAESVLDYRFSTSLDSVENEDDAIFKPGGFFVDEARDRMYFIDQSRMQVRAFAISSGKFYTAYGAGDGDGPNESRSIRAVNVDMDGSVWTVDPRRRLVRRYRPGGELVTTNNFEIGSQTFARIGSGYVQMSGMNRTKVFHFYSEDGTHSRELVSLAKNPFLNIGMTGTLIPSDSGFVYVGFYAGRLARIRDDGSLGFFRSTHYPTPPPRVNSGRNQGLIGDIEGPIRARFPTNASAGAFYVIAAGEDVSYLDAYDLRDGSYKYSIRNPVAGESGCLVIWVTEKYLYTSCPSGDVAKWRRPTSLRE